MCNNVECANYFKSHRCYDRCFRELRKKWESLGRVAGNIVLKDATEEERRAIGRIVGKRILGDGVKFSFSEFVQGLQKTRYAPVDMKKVLDSYFGETLITKQEAKQETKAQKKNFFEGLCSYFAESSGEESNAFLWMKDVITSKKFGYQILVKEYGKNQESAERLGKNVGNALEKLERTKEENIEWPLAVFAAEISGNPHYFDRGTLAGQLLISAISWKNNSELPQCAYRWRELLLEAGIVPDSVSSFVHAYGLHIQTTEGYHTAFEAFCNLGEPFVITLENLKNVVGVAAKRNKVYVVENEMVFSYLVNHVSKDRAAIVCTSGQPRAVAFELVSFMVDGGMTIYYSGDMDPEGIDIADRLWKQYGDSIRVWRMSPADYENGISREIIDEARMSKLERVENPLLRETVKCLKEKRMSAYQENILDDLVKDVK